ncbi:hypothetical protein B0H17DRAFT_1141637 [Mycena rosella]|uniref:Uncharacterized protein n=1 Tax=Mycena rosella TaxID=1033263 RepID=A0AAD7CZR7_MYCRO|nr:hypothetical protein B0H17DRAFT_1141637 [Mycena rosella]
MASLQWNSDFLAGARPKIHRLKPLKKSFPKFCVGATNGIFEDGHSRERDHFIASYGSADRGPRGVTIISALNYDTKKQDSFPLIHAKHWPSSGSHFEWLWMSTSVSEDHTTALGLGRGSIVDESFLLRCNTPKPPDFGIPDLRILSERSWCLETKLTI